MQINSSTMAIALVSAACLAGCASTQINSNTFDIARTYDTLITKQVTFNLQKYISDPDSLPSVVKVTNQTSTTTNSITPTFTIPLTDTIARALTRTVTTTGNSSSISASDQWSQTYTLAPVYDPDQLRRLRTLYEYATRYINDARFEWTYPIIETSGSGSGSSPTGQQIKVGITVGGKPISIVVGGSSSTSNKDSVIYIRRAWVKTSTNRFVLSYEVVHPDITFIKSPGCILCDYGNGLSKEELSFIEDKEITSHVKNVHKLEKNIKLQQDWLYLPGDVRSSDAIALPADLGAESIYVKGKEGLGKFYEFALFTQEASVQGTGSPSSNGQSDGRKTTPSENINIPVSGASTLVP